MIVNMKAQTSHMGLVCSQLETPSRGPLQPSYDAQAEMLEKAEQSGKFIVPASMFAGALTTATRASAADGSGIMDGLWPLIEMLQDFALPVGIGIATWGLIEVMIGNPGGRSKIKYAIGGYAGIYLIPFLFFALRDALGALTP